MKLELGLLEKVYYSNVRKQVLSFYHNEIMEICFTTWQENHSHRIRKDLRDPLDESTRKY